MTDPKAPIERKVWGATGGSTVGVAVAGLLLWLLDTYAWRTEPVPDPVTVAVVTLLPIGLTFVGGFWAKHTQRTDPAAVAGQHRLVARADLQAQAYPTRPKTLGERDRRDRDTDLDLP